MQRFHTKNKCPYILPVISGITLAVAFTFKNGWWLSFFALVPLFCAVLRARLTYRRFLRIIFLFSLSCYVPLMMWLLKIGAVLPFSKRASAIILILCTFLVGLLQGAYIAAATVFFVRIRTGKFRDVLSFSFLFILGEWLQEVTPVLPFPWARIGVMAVPFTPFIQSASLFGSLFISLLILIINGGIAFFIINRRNLRKALFSVVFVAVIFSANVAFGLWRINSAAEQNGFDVAVIQGNFSGLDKWETSSYEMFSQHIKLTEQAITPKTRLVVWPETAIPTDFYSDSRFGSELSSLAKRYNITIVVGAYLDGKDGKSFNSLFAVSPEETEIKPYCKQILAPFGECFPFGNFFRKAVPSLSKIIDTSTSIICAEKPQIITSPFGKIGGIICYESIFSKIALKNVRGGAEILTVASNDSWFGETSALRQHHAHAVMRAVETKRFVLRASNTGISSVISPFGKIENSAQPFKAGFASAEVFLISEKTLYTQIGNIIVLPSFCIIAFSLVKAFKKRGKLFSSK